MMRVDNAVYPNEEQMRGFLETTDERPICMVNLLKFYPKAQYPDGRDSDLTGAEAYAIYATAVEELLESFGGRIQFSGDVERLMLGEVEELWDAVALALYPSRKAMLEMMMSEAYQAIADHRTAGLAGQLNIETVNFEP